MATPGLWTQMAIVVYSIHVGLGRTLLTTTVATLCAFLLLNTIVAVSPFLAYLVTGVSWTGLKLDRDDTVRISGSSGCIGHATLMMA
eukprot:11309625-Ditylum_brightwellii.AAC.1